MDASLASLAEKADLEASWLLEVERPGMGMERGTSDGGYSDLFGLWQVAMGSTGCPLWEWLPRCLVLGSNPQFCSLTFQRLSRGQLCHLRPHRRPSAGVGIGQDVLEAQKAQAEQSAVTVCVRF